VSTTAELVTKVRLAFGEDSTSATQVSDVQIVSFLNDRQMEICADTNILVSAWTGSCVVGQREYSVPAEYLTTEAIQLYRTTGDRAQWWLTRVQLEDLDARRGSGSPRKFATWGLNVSGDNSPAFFVDPIPDANSAANDLICYGRQLPKTMVSGGQGPEIRQRWQNALVMGAAADVCMRLAPGDSQSIALADRYEAKWRAAKQEAESQNTQDLYKAMAARDTMGYGSGWPF
jgi:hypothetical protein